MPHFFTDNNHYFVVSSCATSLIDHVFVDWYQILKIKNNVQTLNSQWPVVTFFQAFKYDCFHMQFMLVHTEEDLGPLQCLFKKPWNS